MEGASIDRLTLSRLIEMTLFIRVLGILTLIYEYRSMRLIVETMRNMLVPLVQLLGVLFVVFYIFAILGMALFGGMREKDYPSIQDGSTPNHYYLMNYNDLIFSMVSLFSLMVVNNWMVQVEMYVSAKNTWYSLYFIIFYYFSVLIALNIIVAFTIDMYSSVERLDIERQRTIDIVKMEMK